MIHFLPTLVAGVIISCSLLGGRKLLLPFLRCNHCLSIHKDKVSWWPCVGPRRPPVTLVGVSRHCQLAAITGQNQSTEVEAGGDGCELHGCFEKMCEMGVWVLRVLAQLEVYCAEGWAPYWHPWSPPLTLKLCLARCVFLSASDFLLLACAAVYPHPKLSFCFESWPKNLKSPFLSCLS